MKIFYVFAALAASAVAFEITNETSFVQNATNATSLFEDIEDRLSLAEQQLASKASVDAIASYHQRVLEFRAEMLNEISSAKISIQEQLEGVFAGAIDSVVTEVSTAATVATTSLEGRLAALQERVDSAKASKKQSVQDAFSSKVEGVYNNMKGLRVRIEEDLLELSMEKEKQIGQMSGPLAEVDRLVSAGANEVAVAQASISTIVATAKSSLNSVAENSNGDLPTKKMWSGGCSYHGYTNGWKPYCHDRSEFNTIDAYLDLTSGHENSEFKVKTTGYYRINIFAIGERRWNHMGIWRNDNHIHHGHQYTDGNWEDQHADLTWKFKQGDTFRVQIYGDNHGHWNFHSWNSGGAHSRLQVEYLGSQV